MLLIQYLVLLTVSYLVLVTETQKGNSSDEKTGNLKLDKKIWEEKSPKPKDTNIPQLGWYGMRRLARSKRETRLNTNTSRSVDISKWDLRRNKRETHLNTKTSRIVDISKWERWEGKRKDKKERMEAQKKKRCLLQG